jgi:serine protease SohB
MMDMLLEYGLFLAKAVTIVVVVGIIAAMLVSLSRRARPTEKLEVNNLNKKYEAMAQALKRGILPKKPIKRK